MNVRCQRKGWRVESRLRMKHGEGRGVLHELQKRLSAAHQFEERRDLVLCAWVFAVVRDQVLGGVDAVHVLLIVQHPCSASQRRAEGGSGMKREMCFRVQLIVVP